MVTALVQFQLPIPVSAEWVKTVFTKVVCKNLPGLIYKSFLLSGDGLSIAGVYLWTSRQAADQFFTEQWRTMIANEYGFELYISFSESSIVLDPQHRPKF